jgi:hypothetical protein
MSDVAYQLFLSGNSVIVWVGVAVAGLLGKWLLGKISNDTAQKYIGRALDEVYDAVGEVYQTFTKSLKASNADGKLTNDEKKIAKSLALATAKANIGVKGIARLSRILGIDSLDSWLATKVEATVANTHSAPKP